MENRDLILRITVPEGWDYIRFADDVANERPVSFSGCQVSEVTDVFSGLKEEIIDGIVATGLSNLLRRKLLTEEVVRRGQPASVVSSILVKFLREIGVSDELIIVDPYFFAQASNVTDYVKLVESVLRPLEDQLSRIRAVTSPDKVDDGVKTEVKRMIQTLKNRPALVHTTSNQYHDRFWITASRTKGILTGSSLNGLGKKYAIVDRLADDDVKDIVDGLVQMGLI